MTSLRPTKWYMYPLLPFGRCQKYNWLELLNVGITCFDIRVRFRRTGEAVFAHGLLEFKGNAIDIMDKLIASIYRKHIDSNDNNKYYIRLTLETSKADDNNERQFIEFCRYINNVINECNATDFIIPFGGTRKFDWKLIVNFSADPNYDQLIGSMRSTYGKLWPWLWTKLNLHKILTNDFDIDSDIVLYDFLTPKRITQIYNSRRNDYDE